MTASAVDLIIMLYDALKKNIILGRRGIEKKDMQYSHKHLIKAQEIVSELINCLDMNYAISEELMAIYEFILRNIEDSNVRKDTAPLEPVIEMIDSLRGAWKEISSTTRGSTYLQEVQA